MATTAKSIFDTLNAINCNEHTENKGKLTYLSWVWAWGICLKHYPDTTYKVIKNAQGMNYHTDGRTCWVETAVTINGLTREESLPVMDYNNKSIPLGNVTSFNVNTAIKRCLAKNLANFGLGLYIYAGEDIPESPSCEEGPKTATAKPATSKRATPKQLTQEQYNNMIVAYVEGKLTNDGEDIQEWWKRKYNPSQTEIDKFNLDANQYADTKTL